MLFPCLFIVYFLTFILYIDACTLVYMCVCVTSFKDALKGEYFSEISSSCSWILASETVTRPFFNLLWIRSCCLFDLPHDSLVLNYSIIAQTISVLAYVMVGVQMIVTQGLIWSWEGIFQNWLDVERKSVVFMGSHVLLFGDVLFSGEASFPDMNSAIIIGGA